MKEGSPGPLGKRGFLSQTCCGRIPLLVPPSCPSDSGQRQEVLGSWRQRDFPGPAGCVVGSLLWFYLPTLLSLVQKGVSGFWRLPWPGTCSDRIFPAVGNQECFPGWPACGGIALQVSHRHWEQRGFQNPVAYMVSLAVLCGSLGVSPRRLLLIHPPC